jgi:hypothetical protein
VSACVVLGCREAIVVVDADASDERTTVCRWHWNDMLRASGGAIRAVALPSHAGWENFPAWVGVRALVRGDVDDATFLCSQHTRRG